MPTDNTAPTIRARFHCGATTATDRGQEGFFSVASLDATYGEDNASWARPDASGQLTMTITKPEAAAAFVVGRDYWLDFTPVAADERDYPNEIQVGDVIDPVPEAGHDGPQYVTAVTQHPDGTALELRPATPEEIAAQPSTGIYTSDSAAVPATPETPTPQGLYLGSMSPETAVYLQETATAPALSPFAPTPPAA